MTSTCEHHMPIFAAAMHYHFSLTDNVLVPTMQFLDLKHLLYKQSQLLLYPGLPFQPFGNQIPKHYT